MWTSKMPSQSKSIPSNQSESVSWTGVSSNDCHNDRSLKSETSHISLTARVASSPLQYVNLPKPKDRALNSKVDGNIPCGTVYINHQGHTVKLARLADPPPLVSFPGKGAGLLDDARFARRGIRKSLPQSKRSVSSEQGETNILFEPGRHKGASVSFINSRKPAEKVVSPYKINSEFPAATGNGSKKLTGKLPSSTLKSQPISREIEDDNCHGNEKSANKNEFLNIQHPSIVREPSTIKQELESGLKKINEDLVALRVLGQADTAEDVHEKGDHKRSLPVDHVTEDSEESKENNSPCKRSRGIHSDSNKGNNVKINQLSRFSLNGSRSNLKLCQSQDPTSSLQNSMCNFSANSKQKSCVVDVKSPPSHDRPKSYDPEKAREFIRRQKKERMSRLKAERDRKKADMDARQQKLNDLSRTSLKLVRASIKSKPVPSNSITGMTPEGGNKIDFNDITSVNSGLNRELSANQSGSEYGWKKHSSSIQSVPEFEKSASDIQNTTFEVSVSPDLSNSQLIRDISDMKSKIEAMAKTLKTTVVNNRGRRPSCSTKPYKKGAHHNGPSGKDQCEAVLKTKFSPKIAQLPQEKVSVVEDDINVEEVLQSNISPAYLHNLTSNLKKMRESLQNVLMQREKRPIDTAVELEHVNMKTSQFKHRRFSSAGSESALGSFLSDAKATPTLHNYLSTNDQKQLITTSFPTLPFSNNIHFSSDRAHHLKATSEADIPAKAADILKSHQHRERDIRPKNSSSKQSAITESPHKKVENCSTWMEKFAGKPYPINIISAVKHKLSVAANNLNEKNIASSTVAASRAAVQPMSKVSSDALESRENCRVPPTVTVRTDSTESRSRATSSMPAPNLIPPNFALNSLERRETFPSSSFLTNYEEQENPHFRPISPVPCSILEALNLEKMNNDFENALNPPPNKSDVIPAEKPLSAPNTPAKVVSGRILHRSNQMGFGVSASSPMPYKQEFRENESSFSESIPSSLENNVKPPNVEVSSGAPSETTSLKVPNINLLSGRVNNDPYSIDSWVSHSRNTTEKSLSSKGRKADSNSSEPSNSSLRDTLEIGHVFNPTALHLQFQAELNILDSFNESLCQVMEIEKVRAVALARHEALLGNHAAGVSMKDKSIDVQKSLMKSSSEISYINYTRGSGDISVVTMLGSGSSSAGTTKSEQMQNDNHNKLVEEETGSHSTVESDVPLAAIQDPSVVVNQSLSEDAEPSKHVEPSSSVGKSISEEIPSTSDDLSEVPEESESKNGYQENTQNAGPNRTVQENAGESSSAQEKNSANKPEENLLLDVTADSFKADSTVTGNEALFVESLAKSECHVFPSVTTGDDMFKFTLQMLEQLMHEEELRVQHKNTLLKLRVKVLGEMARAEVASLDLDKKKLREKGEEGHKDQISALRKKQRGIMLRFQQQREEIERLRRTEELAWQERHLMYLQQMHLIRMQISTHVMLRKFEKTGAVPKKSRVVFRSIRENRTSKAAQKGISAELNTGHAESTPVGLSLTHSSSVSLASLVSDASRSSALSNSSRKQGGAGDSESSHLEDRVLKGLSELENRCRDLKEREKVLHEKRQSVEQIIQWRRKLEEEEHRLKDAEKQAHGRHRSNFTKHMLRDRSTSPFQFLDTVVSGGASNGSSLNVRSISELVRTARSADGNVGGSGSQSASITEEIDSSIPEEVSENTSKPSVDSTRNVTNTEPYANESFESEVSEVKTIQSKLSSADTQHSVVQKDQSLQHNSKTEIDFDPRLPRMSERSNKYPGVTIKVPLSPRLQRVQRRRYSSGSDDSVVLSQTETGSEQSDIEGRISALTEQLQQFKAEAERLRREAKRTRNERLIAKEQSLQKQLQAYETYICQLRTNLDAELKQSSVPIVRPQIKQPRVAPGKVASRRQDAGPIPVSVSQATSPDVSSVRKDDSEFEAVAMASEAASEATSEGASEAASEVPSDVPSEVSENSSLVSNEAPSLVANKAVTKELSLISNEGERTVEALTDLSDNGSEISSAVIMEIPDDSSLVHLLSKEVGEVNEESESGSLTEEQNSCDKVKTFDEVDDVPVVNSKDEIAESTELLKSLTSDEDPEDVSEVLEDELELLGDSDSESSSGVIKVILREKEKDSVDQVLHHPEQEKQVIVSESSHVINTRSELVDRITNEIFEGLMKECLRPVTTSLESTTSAHEHSPSTDSVWNSLINKSLNEATDDILSIYKRKKTLSMGKTELEFGSSRSQDVRKRVSEILAETQNPSVLRAKGRVREMLVTAYGVLSPDDSPCGSPNQSSSPVQQLRSSSPSSEHGHSPLSQILESSGLSLETGTALKTNNAQIGLVGVSVVDSDGMSQEWFDEDFGLTHSRKEAEELRRQQLQIEQEIEQLQQQQAQVQEQIPYYYVREIPNKPPPPYTPPGQAPRLLSSSSSFSPPVEEIRAVPSDRPTILKCIASAVDILYDLRLEGKDVSSVEAPSSYIDAGFGLSMPSHLSEPELVVHKNSAHAYRLFLFDLAKQLVLNAYSCEQEDPNPVWLRPENSVRRRKALSVTPQTREMLHDVVSKQVLVLFGFVPKASKENLTIRWSRKKRDHVDELLVRESQEEERQWTNYEQDEAVVKNNVTLAILDSLLDDTVRVLSDVYKKRIERKCTETIKNECRVY